jgi:ABC-2 type transport system permease protein
MLRNVFLKTLRDQRRGLLWWSAGLTLLAGMMVAIYPSISGIEGLEKVVEAYPEELMALFGAADLPSITSPAGYLNAELFGFMVPFLFIIFAVAQGSSAIAGEERTGTLEILLSEPIPRGQLILEKFASLVASIVLLAVVLWAVLAAGSSAVNMEISLLRLAEMTISATLLGLAFGTLAFAVGGAIGGRSRSIGLTAAAVVATYVLNALSIIVDFMGPTRWLSPFYYYNGATPLVNGLNLVHAVILLAVVLALAATAFFGFQRRDLRL